MYKSMFKDQILLFVVSNVKINKESAVQPMSILNPLGPFLRIG